MSVLFGFAIYFLIGIIFAKFLYSIEKPAFTNEKEEIAYCTTLWTLWPIYLFALTIVGIANFIKGK